MRLTTMNFDPKDYGLTVRVERDDRVVVTFEHYQMTVLRGSDDDYRTLRVLLASERERIKAEMLEDARSGALGDKPEKVQSYDDLDGLVDANVYLAGGCTGDRPNEDKKKGWSDLASSARNKALLAHGVIGKGVEPIDPNDLAASESFTGFDNAISQAIAKWLLDGGIADALEPARPVMA